MTCYNSILHVLVVYAFLLVPKKIDSIECNEWKSKYLFNSTEYHKKDSLVELIRIDTMHDLNVEFLSCKIDFKYGVLKIYVNNRDFLDNDLDLANLLRVFGVTKTFWLILIQNTQGFNQKTIQGSMHSHIESKNRTISKIDIEYDLINTKFDFYQNGTLLAEDKCKKENFDRNMTSFFSMKKLALVDNVFYNNKVCPYVFINTQLIVLSLLQIANSFIFQNRLEYLDIDDDDTNLINTKTLIFYEINIAYEAISVKILNKYIFKNVKTLIINGICEEVQIDLFKYFHYLKLIQILPENFEEFLHSGTQWMNSLNSNLNVNVANAVEFRKNSFRLITLELIDTKDNLKIAYTFPDSDFCLFKNFPHSQMITPVIILGQSGLECTCSLVWLHQYWQRYHYEHSQSFEYNNYVFYNNPPQENLKSKEICLKEKNFTLLYETCNFTQLSNRCKFDSIKRSSVSMSVQGNYNLFFLLKWLQYIIEIFVRPILCFVGITMNILTLVIIKNRKHSKHFKFPMYKHIHFNALFNICFCFIYSFSLVNICIFPKSSFCSSALKNESSQYLKIYFIYFLGNTFRLCCNFSYISFCLSRCISTISIGESGLKKWNEKLNTKLFYSSIFMLSFSFSIFKLFENKVNEIYSNFDKNFPFNSYDVRYCGLETVNTHCKLFWSLNLVNNFLNNILFLFLSVIIDVLMIRFSSKIIAEKRALNCPHLKEAIEFKARLNKMIITNASLFFISHIPEFVVTLLLIIFHSTLLDFCFNVFSCFELIEMAQTFHFISIGFQFFISLKFDRNFLNSFLEIFRKNSV
jgi:hypothetical protein